MFFPTAATPELAGLVAVQAGPARLVVWPAASLTPVLAATFPTVVGNRTRWQALPLRAVPA